MIPTGSRPGEGEHVRVVNPLSGREWTGPVLRWSARSPQLRTFETGEVRWFPPHWVRDVYTPPTQPPARQVRREPLTPLQPAPTTTTKEHTL